jgi:hypothetical protein
MAHRDRAPIAIFGTCDRGARRRHGHDGVDAFFREIRIPREQFESAPRRDRVASRRLVRFAAAMLTCNPFGPYLQRVAIYPVDTPTILLNINKMDLSHQIRNRAQSGWGCDYARSSFLSRN